MKKILAILTIVLSMFISSETLARPHGGPGEFHGGPHHSHYVGGHHHRNGWMLPLGIVLGSAITYTATRPVYQEPVYVQQPVYVPQQVVVQQPAYVQQPVYYSNPKPVQPTYVPQKNTSVIIHNY